MIKDISLKIAKPISGQTYVNRLDILKNYKMVPYDYDFNGNNDEDVTNFRNLNIFHGANMFNFKVFRQSLIDSVLPNWSEFSNSEKRKLINQNVYPDDITNSELIIILGSQYELDKLNAKYSAYELSDHRESIFINYTGSTSNTINTKLNRSGDTVNGEFNFNQKINLNTYINNDINVGDLWWSGNELFFDDGNETFNLLDRPTGLTTVQLRRSTSITLTSTWNDIVFDIIDIENDAEVLSVDNINGDRININEDGLYLLIYDGICNNGAELRIRINDNNVISGSEKNVFSDVSGFAAINSNLDINNSIVTTLNSGDYLSLQGQKDGDVIISGLTFKVIKLDSARGARGPRGIKGEPGSGVKIIVNNDGVNPNPTGGSYSIINFTSGATAIDAGDGETINIIATGVTTPAIKNKFQAVDSIGGQSLNDVTPNPIEWNQIDFQDLNVFNFSSGDSSITVLKNGLYEISYNVNGEDNGNRAVSGVQFRRNGTPIAPTLTSDYKRNSSNNDVNNSLSPYLITLSENDILDVVGFRLGDNNPVETKIGTSFVRVTYLGE